MQIEDEAKETWAPEGPVVLKEGLGQLGVVEQNKHRLVPRAQRLLAETGDQLEHRGLLMLPRVVVQARVGRSPLALELLDADDGAAVLAPARHTRSYNVDDQAVVGCAGPGGLELLHHVLGPAAQVGKRGG